MSSYIASGKWGTCVWGWRMEGEGYKKVQYYQAQYMSSLGDFQGVFLLLLFFGYSKKTVQLTLKQKNQMFHHAEIFR